jgi:Domain of unknown function (DUF4430)
VKPGRGTAIATALLAAALALAGCGLGPGADVGSVELTVTREYGRVAVLHRQLEARESDTAMRLLEGSAEIETRYGGRFVKAIEGVAEASRGGDPYDWFYFVDGVESPIGAAEYAVRGGERVWWDYRDWTATNHVAAVVGSWPAPFVDGYLGRRHPVVLECAEGGAACAATRGALEREGVALAGGEPDDAIRVLVGTWAMLRRDPAARLIEKGPAQSGVYAQFAPRPGGFTLEPLDEAGRPAATLGPGAGLVAATALFGGPPVWVVTGGTGAAVRAAAAALRMPVLRDHYAVAIAGGRDVPLPVVGR